MFSELKEVIADHVVSEMLAIKIQACRSDLDIQDILDKSYAISNVSIDSQKSILNDWLSFAMRGEDMPWELVR